MGTSDDKPLTSEVAAACTCPASFMTVPSSCEEMVKENFLRIRGSVVPPRMI